MGMVGRKIKEAKMAGYNEAAMRQAQEGVFKLLQGGYHKAMAKAVRQFYLAFRKEGFSRGQSLELVKHLFPSAGRGGKEKGEMI